MTATQTIKRVGGKGKATPEIVRRAEAEGSHSTAMIAAWKKQVRLIDLAETLIAATNVRCACGDHGDWSESISGTSWDQPCVWAGCGNCRGTAIGTPVSSREYREWMRMPDADKAEYLAHAVCRGTRSTDADVDMDTLDSTLVATPA